MKPSRAARANAGVRAALMALFFVSGAAGLVYEVVWMRQLSLFLGVSVHAVSATLVAFMAGLGAGAAVFGRWFDRGLAPARTYALLEFGVGAYALAFPWIMDALEHVYAALHGGAEGATAWVVALRFTLAVAALLAPTFLMGGTLPALIRIFAQAIPAKAGQSTGRLYAVNTLGAAAGCALAGFALIEMAGLTGAARIAAVFNIAAGAAVWVLAGERAWGPERAEASGGPRQTAAWDVAALYGVAGFCALALESLWTRALTLVTNNTTYAFSLILAAFLFGSAAGSAMAARREQGRAASLTRFAWRQAGIGVTALLSLYWLAASAGFAQTLTDAVGHSGWLASALPGGAPMAVAALIAFVTVTPGAYFMGAAFPLAAQAAFTGRGAEAGDVGRLYAANIAGCVIGALSAAFAFIPWLGMEYSVVAVAWAAAAMSFALLRRHTPRGGVWAVAALMAALTAGLAAQPNLALTMGMARLDPGGDVEFFEEGPSATVLVSSHPTDLSPGRQPVKRLWINGDPIAGAFREALSLERLQAHIPLLLHKDPHSALVICYGTGSTAGAAAVHGLDEVVAVDISREVFNAGPYFAAGAQNVQAARAFRQVEEDGRNYLLTTRRTFDFITSEPPPPSNAGVVSLYTREYYALVKARLNPGGIVSQWIPLHHLPEEDFKALVAAFVAEFPRAVMWYTKWDAILTGSTGDLVIDLDLIARRMREPRVAQSLADIGVRDAHQLVAGFMMGPERLAGYVRGVTPARDDAPTVEFHAPRLPPEEGVAVKGNNLRGLLALRHEPPVAAMPAEAKARFASQSLYLEGQASLNDGRRAEAAGLFRRALEISPENSDARYAYLTLNLESLFAAVSRPAQAALGLAMLEDTTSLDRDGLFTPQLRFLGGMLLANLERYDEAAQSLEEAVSLDGGYFLAMVNLAGLYDLNLENPERAASYYHKALALGPNEEERAAVLKALERRGRAGPRRDT